MKRNLFLLLSLLLCTSLHAYYPANLFGNKHNNAVMDITHDANNIYVAKLDGLVVIDKNTNKKATFSAKQGTLGYTPTCITSHNGCVWMGTMEGVLLKYDGKEVTAYDYDLYTSITDLLFSPEDMLFVSCMGLYGYQIDLDMDEVEQFSIQMGRPDGLWTGHICLDNEGSLWMSRAGHPLTWSGLAKYTEEDGTVYPFYDNPERRGTYVLALTADADDGIWYMWYNGMGDKKLTRLYDGEDAAVYDCPAYCYDMAFDSRQRLWMAGKKGPLLMMSNGEFTSYPCPVETQLWTSIDIDGDAIYVGTDEALLKFQDGSFTTLDVTITDESSAPDLTGVATLAEEPSAEGVHHWFDLQGRRLEGQSRSGVYIQDGRKRVVR